MIRVWYRIPGFEEQNDDCVDIVEAIDLAGELVDFGLDVRIEIRKGFFFRLYRDNGILRSTPIGRDA